MAALFPGHGWKVAGTAVTRLADRSLAWMDPDSAPILRDKHHDLASEFTPENLLRDARRQKRFYRLSPDGAAALSQLTVGIERVDGVLLERVEDRVGGGGAEVADDLALVTRVKNLARLNLELGSNAPLIVHADGDWEQAALPGDASSPSTEPGVPHCPAQPHPMKRVTATSALSEWPERSRTGSSAWGGRWAA